MVFVVRWFWPESAWEGLGLHTLCVHIAVGWLTDMGGADSWGDRIPPCQLFPRAIRRRLGYVSTNAGGTGTRSRASSALIRTAAETAFPW